MKNELITYIENNIFPLYEKNEKGHGISHVESVINKSLEISKNYDVDENIVYAVAAYHDIADHIDRKNHHVLSAEFFMNDEAMKNFFSEDERILIKEAIIDHRASCDHEPRSIYGKIVSTADRCFSDIDEIIARTVSYGSIHFPEMDAKSQSVRSYEHIKEKYGNGGYACVWLRDEELERSLGELSTALEDKDGFVKRILTVMGRSDEFSNSQNYNKPAVIDALLSYTSVYQHKIIPSSLVVTNKEFRRACEANTCGKYGKSWYCPPAIGTFEECCERLSKYKNVLVFNGKYEIEDCFDMEGMIEGKNKFAHLSQEVRALIEPMFSDSLTLSYGTGCQKCKTCTYPNEPCRFKDKSSAQVEGYGINVSQLARSAAMSYKENDQSIIYFGAIFF